METVFHQQGGEDGSHLFKTQRDFYAFFFAGICNDRVVRGADFAPRRLFRRVGGGSQKKSKEHPRK